MRRLPPVLLLAAFAAVLLSSGCSAAELRNVGMGIGDFTTTWTIGSCHRLDQPEQTDLIYPSDTSPAVPCDSPHESETYAVVPISGTVAAQPERPSPLWLQQALKGACTWDAMAAYLSAGPIDALQNVSVLQILPSAPEWERGVRQVRCDALIGPRTSASVASILSPLRGILAGPAGDRFRVCRAYEQQVGCDQPHNAELINTWIKFSDSELKHDTRAKQKAKILAACVSKASTYLGAPLRMVHGLVTTAELPDTPGDATMKAGRCWLGDAHPGREWTGSLRTGVRRLP